MIGKIYEVNVYTHNGNLIITYIRFSMNKTEDDDNMNPPELKKLVFNEPKTPHRITVEKIE